VSGESSHIEYTTEYVSSSASPKADPKYMIIIVLSLQNTYTMVKHEACLFALGRSSQLRTVFTLSSKGTDLQVRSATEVLYSSHS